MVIFPEIIVTPDSPTVKFYQPREKVNLDQELPRILASQGWGCGTYFNVQFLNHEKTKLLACARFVVSEESESVRTNSDDPYRSVTKTVFSRKADQIGDWWPNEVSVAGFNGFAKETINKGIMNVGGNLLTVSWNPGKKVHQVKNGDDVVFETPDKDIASKVAKGEIPVPKAA